MTTSATPGVDHQFDAAVLAPVRDFLSTPKGLFIGGRWVESASGERFDTVDPATGQTLTTCATAGAEDIDRAVGAARTAFEGELAALDARSAATTAVPGQRADP